jgi:predicted component of type VI protein secretion system
VGVIDRASSSIPPTLSMNNIPTLQPLSIEKCKYKKQRHKTLKQTFKELLKLPKTKMNKVIKSLPLLQNYINLPFVTKLCQFTKQQNQNNKVYNKEGT